MKVIIGIAFFLQFAVSSMNAANIAVPFSMVKGLIIVEAEVNNSQGLFIFDTGSSDLLINGDPEQSAETFSTSNGIATSEEVQVNRIKIGGLVKSNVIGFKMDLSAVEAFLSMELAGIIGGELVFDNVIEIDFKNHMITLRESMDEIRQLPTHLISYKMVEDVPLVEVRIGEVNYQFILDSGATSHFIDKSVVASHGNHFTEVAGTTTTTVGSTVASEKHIASSLQIGSYNTADIPMVVGDYSDLIPDVKLAGLISLSALNAEKVIINTEQQHIHF